MRVLVIGRTEILYETAILLSKWHEVCGIITSRSVPEYSKKEEDFESLAKNIGCSFLLTQSLDEKSNKFIEELKSDIGVSLNWVSVIKEDTLKLLPRGILNAHFADLPRFRGNAVVNWALIRGENKIPLTIHYMTAG